MSEYAIYVWLAVVIFAVIIESLTAQLVSIWFVAGGLAALITSLCNGPVWLQFVLFFAITAVTLLATRPLVKKMVSAKKVETNADRYVGKEGLVTVGIDNTSGVGEVKVLGSIWTALSEDGSNIPAGTNVLIKEIRGVKLIVTPAAH